VASLLAAAAFLRLHAIEGPRAAPSAGLAGLPTQLPPLGYGWWSYWDQWHYLQAVLAWGQGNLDPAWHWYLPGYPLLGAAFAWATPADPFLIPNLACLLAALWQLAGLAVRLLPGVPCARALGAALFVAVVLPRASLHVWVEPWTSTPQTVGLYGCLLCALRFLARPNRRDAFLAALAGTAVFAFRPADAVVIDGVCALVLLGKARGSTPGPRQGQALGTQTNGGLGPPGPSGVQGWSPWPYFLLGAAIPVLLVAAVHLLVFGLAPGPYVTLSGRIGFEWRLLPMRWVLLMLDPRPLLSDGQGLIGAFPSIAPGIAGMAAALATATQRRAHLLVIAVAVAELALMLCYRDLHPTELWRFELYHYFVWLPPLAALYVAVLLRLLWRPGRLRAAAAALAVLPALFLWRPELSDPVALQPPRDGAIALPAGLPRTDLALLVRADTDWDHADNDAGTLEQAGHRSERLADLKGYPLVGGLLVVPLRPLPEGAGVFRLNPALRPDPEAPALLVRQRIVWGLPCFIRPDRADCGQAALLPPPALADDGVIGFGQGGNAAAWIVAGWSHAEWAGRWTDGDRAVLRFRLPPGWPAADGISLALHAHGYAPDDLPPTAARLFVNGGLAARWTAGNPEAMLRAAIGPALIGVDRVVTLRLAIDTPRRPADHGGGPDGRRLGLFVTRLTVAPDRP
jgi:hypothetical protein